MPIDPSVLLLGLQPQARTPYDAPDVVAERRARVEQLREAAKAKQDAEYENQLYDWAVKSNLGPDGLPDFTGVRKSLAAVAPRYLQKFDAAMNTAKKSTLDSQKLQDEHEGATALAAAQLATGTTADNYSLRKPHLESLSGTKLPDQWDDQTAAMIQAIGDRGTSVPDQLKTKKEMRDDVLGGKYLSAMAKFVEAQPNLTDDDVARQLNAMRHDQGMPLSDFQTVNNIPVTDKDGNHPLKQWAADYLHPTTPHEKVQEQQAKDTLENTKANQAQIDAREQRRIQLEEQGQKNTEAYRANELALQRLRLGQDATDKATSQGYNVSKNRLDTLRKPVEEAMARMSRLVETVNQGTPQADALIAPELLTVMAGGFGSGLRMSEAELSRIVGGRSNLEGIKAALNKWQVDPSKALSVTPAQRQQIRSLISAVNEKAVAKIQRIQQADNDLLDATSVDAQRRIIVGLQKDVADISTEGGPAAGDKTVSLSELQAIARRKGTTVEQEKARATAAGYTIK